MRTKIYTYSDDYREIEIQDKPIECISVEVLSGDEVVTFQYEDGTIESFDSAYGERSADYFDGGYVVPKELVNKWLDFNEPPYLGTTAYARLSEFMNYFNQK